MVLHSSVVTAMVRVNLIPQRESACASDPDYMFKSERSVNHSDLAPQLLLLFILRCL